MAAKMSTKSVIKSFRKSDATMVQPTDIVKLNFGQLIDLALGQTEDSRNYGAVSFGLLRELLLAIVDRMGMPERKFYIEVSLDTLFTRPIFLLSSQIKCLQMTSCFYSYKNWLINKVIFV